MNQRLLIPIALIGLMLTSCKKDEEVTTPPTVTDVPFIWMNDRHYFYEPGTNTILASWPGAYAGPTNSYINNHPLVSSYNNAYPVPDAHGNVLTSGILTGTGTSPYVFIRLS